jgi:hypothetical protein
MYPIAADKTGTVYFTAPLYRQWLPIVGMDEVVH